VANRLYIVIGWNVAMLSVIAVFGGRDAIDSYR
jgi:hypothetical protein